MDSGREPPDTPLPKTRRPRGPALSISRITRAALLLIDESGLEAFSFRNLARALGCQAMSIYHYFPSKTHLFEALVDDLLAEAMVFGRAGTWQEQLHAISTAYRQMALNHPGFFQHFATFRMNNRAGLTFLEAIATILEGAGLHEEARARHFRFLRHYLVGACLSETTATIARYSATAPVPFEIARRDFPALMAIGPHFGADRNAASFAEGITLLIRGIEADLAG